MDWVLSAIGKWHEFSLIEKLVEHAESQAAGFHHVKNWWLQFGCSGQVDKKLVGWELRGGLVAASGALGRWISTRASAAQLTMPFSSWNAPTLFLQPQPF
jgi:hypothetical protein